MVTGVSEHLLSSQTETVCVTVVVILVGTVTVVTGTTGGQDSRVVTCVVVTRVPSELVVVTVAVDTHSVTEGTGEDSQWSLVTVVVTVSGSPPGLVVVRVTVDTQGSDEGAEDSVAGSVEGTGDSEEGSVVLKPGVLETREETVSVIEGSGVGSGVTVEFS